MFEILIKFLVEKKRGASKTNFFYNLLRCLIIGKDMLVYDKYHLHDST